MKIGEIERTREWEPLPEQAPIAVPVEPSPDLPEREPVPVGVPG